jgi:hypothetical protein
MKQQTTDQSKCRMCGSDVDEVSLHSNSIHVGSLGEWFCSCKCANQAVTDREARETIREMLTVWEALTDAQRADALATAKAGADKAEAAFLAAPAVDADSEHSYCVMTVHLVLCGHDCPGCDNSKPAEVCTVNCNGVWYPEECGKRTATGSCPERASDLIDDGYGTRARGGLVYFG